MLVLCTEGAECEGLFCRTAMSPECRRRTLPLVAAHGTLRLLLAHVTGILHLHARAPVVQVDMITVLAPFEAVGVLLLLEGIDRGLNGEILSADLVWISTS